MDQRKQLPVKTKTKTKKVPKLHSHYTPPTQLAHLLSIPTQVTGEQHPHGPERPTNTSAHVKMPFTENITLAYAHSPFTNKNTSDHMHPPAKTKYGVVGDMYDDIDDASDLLTLSRFNLPLTIHLPLK